MPLAVGVGEVQRVQIGAELRWKGGGREAPLMGSDTSRMPDEVRPLSAEAEGQGMAEVKVQTGAGLR